LAIRATTFKRRQPRAAAGAGVSLEYYSIPQGDNGIPSRGIYARLFRFCKALKNTF